MGRTCATRLIKNARYLQSTKVGYFPESEPLAGFPSMLRASILGRLDRISPEEIEEERLALTIRKGKVPSGSGRIVTPLFSGTLRFVQATFVSSGISYAVPGADLQVAIRYSNLAVGPISSYCSQYGANGLNVASTPVPFDAPVASAKYNDSILSGWVDRLGKANGLGPDSCLVFLNPQGVVNTDADATQGILGYHNMSSSGIPYEFVNVMGTGLTIDDRQDAYAVALSHETAEMTVDPKADGSNPEVCDPCAGNCGTDHRNYFDSSGKWLGSTPAPGFAFVIDGIATPATVAQCPAPPASCAYPPP